MAKMKITNKEQQVVADVLAQFMFTRTMDDVIKVWKDVFEQYELCDDPFTHMPVTPKEYCENLLEYEKQTMIERYGHCDGLE